MREHFGVGLGLENMTGCGERASQLGVVLDDAVVDETQASRCVEVRVSVGIVTPPWVAQRVWEMPTDPRGGEGLRWLDRSPIRPAFFLTSRWLPSSRATPALS